MNPPCIKAPYVPNLQFYLEQLSDKFEIDIEVLREAIYLAKSYQAYQDEPFNTLETDPEFSERVSFIKTFLNSQGKCDLQWLINRAYFVGYQNGGTDGN